MLTWTPRRPSRIEQSQRTIEHSRQIIALLTRSWRSLSRAPVIWLFLVVQGPNTSDMRRVTGLLRPFDCFVQLIEGLKDMVRVVFNDVILYGAALWPPLRSRLDKDARHSCHPKLLWP